MGLILASVRGVWHYLKERFVVSVEVQNSDHCYEWVLEWLAEQPDMANSQRFSVETAYTGHEHKVQKTIS